MFVVYKNKEPKFTITNVSVGCLWSCTDRLLVGGRVFPDTAFHKLTSVYSTYAGHHRPINCPLTARRNRPILTTVGYFSTVMTLTRLFKKYSFYF